MTHAVSVKNIWLFLLQSPVGPRLQAEILQKSEEVNRRGIISGDDIGYVMGDLAKKFIDRVEGSGHHSAIAEKDLEFMIC